ncbi:MAG TPA: hypothetical protein VMB03_31215 [Bryobacteraceae bacterium]|nr:hypothetical protein [Bryobacteraceae bacterium]
MMATAKIVAPAEPQQYLWWFPGSPVKVRLALSLVEPLKQRVICGEAEEGLLFGEIRLGVTDIVEFQPVEGSSVGEFIERLPPERKAAIVGYYRSDEREEFHLTPQDRLLAKVHFASPYNVFLVIRRGASGGPLATFFFQDRDCRMTEFAFLEFPFDAALLVYEQSGPLQKSPPAQPLAVVPHLAALVPVVEPAGKQRFKGGLGWKVAGWVCALLAAAGVGVVFGNDASRERVVGVWRGVVGQSSVGRQSAVSAVKSVQEPSLSLGAIREHGFLAVTWDHESPLIASATSGLLVIQDGERTRSFSFSPLQLQDGSLLFVPLTDKVLMQFTLTAASGKKYVESVTLALPEE